MLLALPILGALAVGCVGETVGDTLVLGGVEDAPKLYAELAEEAATRTCIDSETLVPGQDAIVLWMPEDQLGVFSADKGNVLYINDEKEENIANASFSGTTAVSGELKYAYYPYDKANDGKEVTALAGVVPAKQMMGQQLPADYKYGDPRSVYMFMDSNGKLCAGPVWDFDRATFQNTTLANRDGNDRVKPYNEWICWRTSESDTYSYIWYKQLIKDPIFQNTVKERWKVIYPSLTNLSTKIEGYRKSLRKSFDIDSKMWPTDDDAIHEHKNPFTDWAGDENINNWDDLIQNFIDVYEARLAGMDALIQQGKFTK